MADVLIALAYNADNTIASIDRYQDGQLAVEGDYTYDAWGRLIGLVYHQGETVLNSYAWTYSDSGQWSVASGQNQSPLPPGEGGHRGAALVDEGGSSLATSHWTLTTSAWQPADPSKTIRGIRVD